MAFNNFTDNLIESFFANNNPDNEGFFKKLECTIQSGQAKVSNELEVLMKENECNSKIVNDTKEMYYEKLENITHLHNNFEFRVDTLNKLYSDKLAYISVLSKNLGEFEKFKKNIIFAKKIFAYINDLNKSDDINVLIPEIFTNPDKILEEGVEVFEAFRQMIDSAREYKNFVNNFKSIESRIRQSIKNAIQGFYENNELDKLEKLMKITEILHAEFIVDIYVSYIVEDNMRLSNLNDSITKIDFRQDQISEEMFTQIFTIVDELHENVIKNCSEQYAGPASKIYLIFPETRQKGVIANLVQCVLNKVILFRSILVNEKSKSDETYVRIIEYMYPKSLKFVQDFKETLEYSKTDLWNAVEQETTRFLREVEGVYMSKEKNLLELFLLTTYDYKIKKSQEMKRFYADAKYTIDQLQSETENLFSSTNLSILLQRSETTIGRYNNLIGKNEEKTDLIETFCKKVFDKVQDLLLEYCSLVKFMIVEREKKGYPLTEKYFHFFLKISRFNNDFREIFIYNLRDFFKSVKFFDVIEEYVKKCHKKIEIAKESLFSQLSSFASSELVKLLKGIKYKEAYAISKSAEYKITTDVERICFFISPVFGIVSEWNENENEKFKQLICQMFTNIIYEKMIDILKNAKVNERGVNVLKMDFQKLSNTFAERLDEFYYDRIYQIFYLVEIFTTPKNDLEQFLESLKKDKYDPELLKILIKKRNALNIK